MTLNQIAEMLEKADRLSRNPSMVLQLEAATLLRRAERAIKDGARLEPEVTCCMCERPRRAWFATGVEDGRIWPVCSRVCIEGWRAWRVGRVFMRDGRDEQKARRVA